jgi:outer membrane protein TolC
MDGRIGMFRRFSPDYSFLPLCCGWMLVVGACLTSTGMGQEPAPPIRPEQITTGSPPVSLTAPEPEVAEHTLPINLPTALRLADSRPVDVAVASERIRVAAAELERAKVLWLPTIQFGVDYFRHDGRIQDVQGNLFDASKSSLMIGAAPVAVFAVTDALFEPLAARQIMRAREADLRTVANDIFLTVAEAYFNVQQARGELAGALDAQERAASLLKQVESLTSSRVDIVAPSERPRARAELSRRRAAVHAAREHWRTSSADLVRILRLDAGSLVQPMEPPHLRVTLVALERSVDELIPLALTNRPELASQQALVQATLERLHQERLRPLVPSVLLRGASTNPAGTLAGGAFGGGRDDSIGKFAARSDFDVQVLWEFQNLGFGNRARIRQRRAEHQLSLWELFRVQDRVAAEVAVAHAQLHSAAARIPEAETGLKEALDSLQKNLAGMKEPRAAGEVVTLFNRPQEVVAAVTALAQAYGDYYGAIGDYNRAQFRLYRALGDPAKFAATCP